MTQLLNTGSAEEIDSGAAKRRSWAETLGAFWEHVVPELVFAILLVAIVPIGRGLGLPDNLQNTILLVGVLVLGAEVLIRWNLHSMLKPVGTLDAEIHKFGLAVRDQVELTQLAGAYVDLCARELARMLRLLATNHEYRLPVQEVFFVLIRILKVVEQNKAECRQIRAVASKNLLAYVFDRDAKEYFKENAKAARHLLVRRLFVLTDQESTDSVIQNLIGSQQRELLASNRMTARDGGVRWIIEPGYMDDWVLFGTTLLVRHDVPGSGFATLSFDPDDIKHVEDKFEELWRRAKRPEDFRIEDGEGKPTGETSRPMRGARPNIVGAHARDVVSDAGEVA